MEPHIRETCAVTDSWLWVVLVGEGMPLGTGPESRTQMPTITPDILGCGETEVEFLPTTAELHP